MQKLKNFILANPHVALILLITIVYLFFQTDMMLRTTGDEKTYVAQALEMEQNGFWFIQTWAGEHDYYKGPLHFILLRIGFLLFGHTMFATLYMNFFGLIAATLLLYNFLYKEIKDRSWALFYAGSFATSIGLYAHMFASQMEAELVITYAIFLYYLNKLDTKNTLVNQLILWGIIGIVGWLKSPAYSIFLSASAAFYWILTQQFVSRAKEAKSWIALLFGIAVGIGGYAPILYYDGDVFIQKYIIKESLNKGANGVPWESAFFPVFTYYLAPWMFASIFAFFIAIITVIKKSARYLDANEIRLVKLALSVILPTLAFFTIHPYRGEIYALPTVSATWLLALLYWRAYSAKFEKTFIWMMRLSAIVLSIIPIAISVLYFHLSKLPDFWPSSLIYITIIGGVFTLWFVFSYSKKVLREGPGLLIISFIPLYLMLGLVMQSFGKGEMEGLHKYIEQNSITKPIGYYNLHRNVWNEYGYLNFWVGHKIVGIHSKESMRKWLEKGNDLIIPSRVPFNVFEKQFKEIFPEGEIQKSVWKRWIVHGKNEYGESRFKKYFDTSDITNIQQDSYIIKLKKESSSHKK